MASENTQPALRRRPSISQAVRRLARRLSISSLSHSRSLRAPPSPPSSAVSASRPPSRLALSRLRRPSNPASASTSTVTPAFPEPNLSSWPPPASLLRRGGKHSDYDVSPLLQCKRVPELWDESESADTLVYLCAKEDAGKKDPSFKVNGELLKKRSTFFEAALADRWQSSSSAEKDAKALYFPPWDPSASRLDQLRDRIAIRNLFSFILSSTKSSSSVSARNSNTGFAVLSPPHEGLLLTDFTRRIEMYYLPLPSSASLSNYIVSHGLDDPRASPRRTLDVLLLSTAGAIPLSRQIRRESFLHAAGQYLSLIRLPEFALLPEDVKLRLQRNHHAIAVRVQRAQTHLKALSFPVIPGGGGGASAPSRTPSVPPGWEPAFKELRALVISHYSKLFRSRSWPPRNFSRGMALMVLRDMQVLQSLLRDSGGSHHQRDTDPYRTLLAHLTGSSSRYPKVPPLVGSNLTAATHHHRLSPDEAAVMVLDCWSAGAVPTPPPSSPGQNLIDRVRALEIRAATGKTSAEFVEAREGRWILLSVVRRAVEEVVGRGEWDGVKWGWGVEWWLCADWENNGDDEDEDEEEEKEEHDGIEEGSRSRRRRRKSERGDALEDKELMSSPVISASSSASTTTGPLPSSTVASPGRSGGGEVGPRPSLFGG